MSDTQPDVVQRAREALEGVRTGPWQVVGYGNLHAGVPGEHPPLGKIYGGPNAAFVAAARSLVPELVAEVERLRLRVRDERAVADQIRRRDGDCICDHNPETTSGPDEFCPWHGRPYRELVEGLESQGDQIERLRAVLADVTAQR